MRRSILTIALVLVAVMAQAQDYAACNTYIETGDYAKAKQCLYAYTRPADNGGLCFYKMNLAVAENNGEAAKNIMAEAEKYPATDYYAIATKTIYIAYSQSPEAARLIFDPLMKSHKGVPPAVLMETTRAFFRFKMKDLDYAMACINTLEKELKQPHADWLVLKGDYYAAQGDHGTALNFYNKAIDADAKKAVSYHRKAIAYRRIKNLSASLAEMESAIKLNPEFTQAILNKGEIQFEMGHADDAIATYATYFQMAPDDIKAWVQYSLYLFKAKRFADAEKAANTVAQKDPENLSAVKLLAYTNYEMGKFSEGLRHMESFFAKADTSVIQSRDYEYLAKYYQRNNSDSLAIEALKKAVAYEEADADLFSETGSLMIKKARFEDAFALYQLKQQRFTMTSADNYNYGRAALMTKNLELADSIFGKVCEVQPNWAQGFLMKARVSTNLDPDSKEGRAFPYYDKFISIAGSDTVNAAKNKPGLLEAYRYMGYYYFLKKDNETSRTYWKKVLELDPADKQAKDVLKDL